MKIFSLIGELFKPGSIGTIDFEDNDYSIRRNLILIRFIISLILFGIIEYVLLIPTGIYQDILYTLKVNSFIFLYLFISFNVNIKPDYDNLGWIPFIIGNPFRFSDNINRFLVYMKYILWPGKFISRSFICFLDYLKTR